MKCITNKRGNEKYKEPRKVKRILKKRKATINEDDDSCVNSSAADKEESVGDDDLTKFKARREALNALIQFSTADILKKFPEYAKKDCPAFGKECLGCHKTGHFQAVGTQGSNSTPKPETAGSITIRSITPDDMVELGVSPASSNSTILILVLPDSGASIDAIPAAIFWSHFKHISLIDGGPNAVTATRAAISSLGHFPATLSWSSGSSLPLATTIHVLHDLQHPVLSKASQKLFGMLPAHYPHSCVLAAVMPPPLPASAPIDDAISTLRVLMAECPLIFDGVFRPMRGPPCHFQLKEGTVPSAIRGSRLIAVPLMPRVKQELDSLEDQGIVSKVPEPTLWVQSLLSQRTMAESAFAATLRRSTSASSGSPLIPRLRSRRSGSSRRG